MNEHLSTWVKKYYGLEAKCHPLNSEFGDSFLLRCTDGRRFLLKVSNPGQSLERLELENAALQHLAMKGLRVFTPRPLPSLNQRSIEIHEHGDDNVSFLRLFEWIPGRLFSEVNPQDRNLLENLGNSLGQLSHALSDFHHPFAPYNSEWDPWQVEWIEGEMAHFNQEQITCLSKFLHIFRTECKPARSGLRRSIVYHDANPANVLVDGSMDKPRINAFIDFGDIQETNTINELAIALAYAMMGKADPIYSAAQVVRGYHKVFPLKEIELDVLFGLSCARLLISVTKSALRRKTDPQNTYWQVSDDAAWAVLETLQDYPPHLALCHFRYACGLEPSPSAKKLRHWLSKQDFYPVTGTPLQDLPVTIFDWSVSSPELGGMDDLKDTDKTSGSITRKLQEENTEIGIGKYDEPRPVYISDAFVEQSGTGRVRRTVHLGIDLFMPAGSPLYAPLEGTVHSIANDTAPKGYGPLLILEHTYGQHETFYTLYGHNSRGSLGLWKPGDHVSRGQCIAYVGDRAENGDWAPHLHFQVITNMLHYVDDFPGVVNPDHRAVWKSLCPDPNLILGIRHHALAYTPDQVDTLLRRRKKVLPPNLHISYNDPLHIVRGWKQYLLDAEGRRYLDTVNNIAHVGHEHPAIVRAGQQQMAVLNTNTRYLHKNILDLAEALRATLPDHLEVLYFVNSGSEANELAIRMARHRVQSRETLVLEQGYHGHTGACAEVSAYKFDGPGGRGRAPHIRLLEVPGIQYPKTADLQMQVLSSANGQSGLPPDQSEKGRIFIHESILSCAGQVVPPDTFLPGIYANVHKNGGICIADEVQTGLGRTGKAFWAFELFDLNPDIVTIGKPFGNGHPVGAVAATREIAEAFANGMEFFSSFGGNPVSCAIAREVLRVIKNEDLQTRALQVGQYLKRCLADLKNDHPLISDVRGEGFFLGVALSTDDGSPATRQAAYVVNRMRTCKVLTSVDGPGHNVIKIKPPMCFDHDDADVLVATLDQVLSEDFCRMG